MHIDSEYVVNVCVKSWTCREHRTSEPTVYLYIHGYYVNLKKNRKKENIYV